MKFVLLLFLFVGALSLPGRAEILTYADLVGRLTDLQHLATPPALGEEGALASSYDRHSAYDALHDKYVAWDANADNDFGGEEFVVHDGNRSVMADIQGPGCIWRIWTATPGPGHVKIYLDGAKTPAIDLPWAAYFDGRHEPFTRSNLCYHTGPADSGEKSGGWNNFTPIPFRKSCRIVADEGWGAYFHFNYTRFAPRTVVPTFKLPLSPADSAALDAANEKLGHCGRDPAGPRPREVTDRLDVTVEAGKESVLADWHGARAITGLRIRFDPGQMPHDAEAQRRLLRELTLSIAWDGEKNPSVWAPLGDFFGSGSGAAPHLNLCSGLTDDGTWYSYWYMPFARSARVVLGNDANHPVSLHAEIVRAPLTQPALSLLRFHAKWHRDAFLPTRTDRKIDWTILNTQGLGRFVGTQLHVWSPCNGWWGEGDEKFFVDGEKFPSTFGTGSEDYFGYAWGRPELFARPFHSQTTNENNQGNVSDNRWHIIDSVPFQTSFEGDIEKYYPNNRPAIYAATAFWYLTPDGHDPYKPVPVAQRVGYWLEPVVYHEPNSIEGETMHPTVKPLHAPAVQTMSAPTAALRSMIGDRYWGGNAQLFWPAQSVGERLELGFDIEESHDYFLMAHLTYGPAFGIVQVEVDGKEWGSPVDLFSEKTKPGGIGGFRGHLESGQHVLSIQVVGKNPHSSGYAFGLDYLKTTRAY